MEDLFLRYFTFSIGEIKKKKKLTASFFSLTLLSLLGTLESEAAGFASFSYNKTDIMIELLSFLWAQA